MADGKGNNVTMVLVALIAASATVMAAIVSAIIKSDSSGAPRADSTVPSGPPSHLAADADLDDEEYGEDGAAPAPGWNAFASLPAAPVRPFTAGDPMRDAWGNTIAGSNHTNLGAAFGMYVDRLDLQFDGYAELQREDRNADGCFELYRVDVNVDNLTDDYFDANPFNGMVQPAPPR